MAKRDRATVDIDLVRIPSKFLSNRQRLSGERLVGFDQVEVGDGPACLF